MDARLNLKWLISIVPRGRGNAVAQICNENHIAVQLLAQARYRLHLRPGRLFLLIHAIPPLDPPS